MRPMSNLIIFDRFKSQAMLSHCKVGDTIKEQLWRLMPGVVDT